MHIEDHAVKTGPRMARFREKASSKRQRQQGAMQTVPVVSVTPGSGEVS